MTVETTSASAKKIIAAVNAALLKPAELGTGFTKATFTPPDPTDTTARLPCGQLSAAVLFPNALRTGTEIVKGNTVQFDESVSVFLDAKTAAGAYEASVAGFNCKNGTTGTTPVTITATQDVTAQVGGDKAQAWDLKLGQDSAVLVGVRTGVISIGYTFIVAGGTDTSTLPSPLELAKVATARLVKLQQ